MKAIQPIISLMTLVLVGSCNLQGKGTKISADFHPGIPNAEDAATASSTPTPTPTPTPTAVAAKVPVLTVLTGRTYSTTPLIVGNALTLDVNDTANNAEAASGYTCCFDRLVDGAVAATTACSSLPGTISASTLASTGSLNWTPDSSAFGPYEIKFTGTNSKGSASSIVVIDVQQAFLTTSLASYWDAGFATGSALGSNSSSTAAWQNLVALGTNNGTLTNFGFSTASGWTGDQATAISSAADGPYRLTFDGTDDYVDFGTGLNANTDISYEFWMYPTAVATNGSVIFGNRDNANNFGMEIRQSNANAGKIELVHGDATLMCESSLTLTNSQWYHMARHHSTVAPARLFCTSMERKNARQLSVHQCLQVARAIFVQLLTVLQQTSGLAALARFGPIRQLAQERISKAISWRLINATQPLRPV